MFKDSVIELADLLQALGAPADEAACLSMREYIERGPDLWHTVENAYGLDSLIPNLPRQPLEAVALEAPLRDTHKLILLAGNYREHIAEAGFCVPQESASVTPQFFMKPPSTTVIGPEQPILLGRDNMWLDWEVELAAVIGRRSRYLPESEAMAAVFGYTILNDISERQLHAGLPGRVPRERDPFFDWLNGKWCDTFAPMGPYVVSASEIPDPGDLRLTLSTMGSSSRKPGRRR